jgi:hypothetical protein
MSQRGNYAGKQKELRRGLALTKEVAAEYGPVQIIVLGFEDPDPQGEILAELAANASSATAHYGLRVRLRLAPGELRAGS